MRHLGYSTVSTVRAGKYITVTLSATDQQQAERLVDEMCYRLLANPVIEDYRFEVTSAQ